MFTRQKMYLLIKVNKQNINRLSKRVNITSFVNLSQVSYDFNQLEVVAKPINGNKDDQ